MFINYNEKHHIIYQKKIEIWIRKHQNEVRKSEIIKIPKNKNAVYFKCVFIQGNFEKTFSMTSSSNNRLAQMLKCFIIGAKAIPMGF